jgi:hypothetical protein
MSAFKLPGAALDQSLVDLVSAWVQNVSCDETSVLVVGGPPGTAKRQHVLAGLYGMSKWPPARRATADPNDTSGEYSFMLRTGLAEIDFGLHAGNYRKNATTCVQGAVRSLENQQRFLKNTTASRSHDAAQHSNPHLLLFRNCQAARPDCILAGLNNAANSKTSIILLTERPSTLTHTTSAWKTDVILVAKQEGEREVSRRSVGYSSQSLHDQKAVALAKSAARVLQGRNGVSIAAVRKLATELQKDQHCPILIATLLMKELEVKEDERQKTVFREASQKLIDGIENGYRLNLHLERFLASLVSSC